MYSPAEDPQVEAFLDVQLGKRNSHEEAWAATEAKFGVVRPVLGDAATSGADVAIEGKPDWAAEAERDAIDFTSPERVAARRADAETHARNNHLTHMHPDTPPERAAQQAINARHRASWQNPEGA
jgi:hypothetical protein